MLNMVTHLLLVDINSALFVLYEEPIFNEIFERVFPQFVDFLRIWIRIWQVDLRLHNIQEAQGVSRSHLSSFLGVEGVVGGGEDA